MRDGDRQGVLGVDSRSIRSFSGAADLRTLRAGYRWAPLRSLRAGRLLETAAGTGIVTRALAANLPEAAVIDATDLNQAMIDHAARPLPSPRVAWRQADAQALPFPDTIFDAFVCQFGVMFFPDMAKAFSETHRVLRPSGRFVFNVWDRIRRCSPKLRCSFLPRRDGPRRVDLTRSPRRVFAQRAIDHRQTNGGFPRDEESRELTARFRARGRRQPSS
jgi:SAM-dependent methyltransferase